LVAPPQLCFTRIWVHKPDTQYFAFVRNSQCSFHFLVVAHVYSGAVYTYKHCVYIVSSPSWF
jgi:hypothetical protein